MSSSANAEIGVADVGPPGAARLLEWSAFPDREVPRAAGEFVSPERELSGLAQRYEQDLRKSRELASAALDEAPDSLLDVAVFIGRLGQLVAEAEKPLAAQGLGRLHRQFRVVKDEMVAVLSNDGIEVLDPTGRAAAEVMDWVDVSTWLHREEYDDEVVARTEKCAVFRNGEAVRLARVQMGAPLEAEPSAEPAADGDEQDNWGSA